MSTYRLADISIDSWPLNYPYVDEDCPSANTKDDANHNDDDSRLGTGERMPPPSIGAVNSSITVVSDSHKKPPMSYKDPYALKSSSKRRPARSSGSLSDTYIERQRKPSTAGSSLLEKLKSRLDNISREEIRARTREAELAAHLEKAEAEARLRMLRARRAATQQRDALGTSKPTHLEEPRKHSVASGRVQNTARKLRGSIQAQPPELLKLSDQPAHVQSQYPTSDRQSNNRDEQYYQTTEIARHPDLGLWSPNYPPDVVPQYSAEHRPPSCVPEALIVQQNGERLPSSANNSKTVSHIKHARTTECINSLEYGVLHDEETIQNMQNSRSNDIDDCSTLRHENSLSEKILLESGE
jgi:hypothetical protein